MADVSNRDGGADLKGEKIDVGQDVIGRDKNVYYGAVPTVTHHNSLPNQPYFFGRKDELEKIANALDPEAQGWGVLISGPGGIGKTALAIRAGHLASDEDYPIKIFLSAKVIQLTPQGVEDLQDFMLPNYMTLLAELARELGDENIAKIDPAQRANEVRRLLADCHALIIIDNLETFDEKTERPRVFQFLGRLPRSCKAIVTSRRRIDTPAEIIRLDKLERDDALDLIASIAKRNRHVAKTTEAERIELYEITRGHPLLIEWLAGQLGNPKSQCRTVADACKFIENTPKDNDPLEFIFGDLLDTFTEHETAVLAALTYFTQPAEVRWIAEIAQISTLQAETALEDLADRSVLVVEGSKYLLPLLTVTFLRRARPEVIAEAGNSLSDRAYALALENGWQEYNRFPTLDAEWPTIAAALSLMMRDDNDRLQELCDALDNFLDFSGRWDERLHLNLEAENRALAANDVESAGWRAYAAGWVFYLRRQSSEVLACAQRVEQYWARAGARERAICVRLYGIGYQLAENYPAAIEAYRESLNLRRALSDMDEDESIVLNDLAESERLAGDYEAAEPHYRKALNIAKKIEYQAGIVAVTGNLSALALDCQDWLAAERWAREALPLAEALGKQESIAHQCVRLAKALVRQGRISEGLPYAQRAVAIFSHLNSPSLETSQMILKEYEDSE